MLTQLELEKNPLFDGITHSDYMKMLVCFQAVQRSYRAEELIYDFGNNHTDAIGVVERGSAALIRIDEEGTATVLEELGTGGVFGRNLAFGGSVGDSLEVVCRTPCDILFIDYPHLFRRCENACSYHSRLVQNMLGLLSDKAQALSERIDVLSRRSIRDKLLCYFRQISEKTSSDTFTLPFSLSVLADYIATDRSAMMRELKRLRDEGVICSDGRQITMVKIEKIGH